MNRHQKQAIMLVFDVIALSTALWSAYALRLTDWWPQPYLEAASILFVLTPIIGILIFLRIGLYEAVVRYFSSKAVIAVLKGIAILVLCQYAIAALADFSVFPRSVPIIFALTAAMFVAGTRLAIRNYYHWLIARSEQKQPVIIYGAGGAGIQLSIALEKGADFIPVAFLDDDKNLWGRQIHGIHVYAPKHAQKLIDEVEATQLLVALPSADSHDRQRVLNELANLAIKVKVMPSMPEIVKGDIIPQLRDVQIEDLLGREPVPPLEGLIESSLQNKNVLVTGAGGSIGSEIARQAIAGGAKSLILYEMSEFALYSIEKELHTNNNTHCQIIPVLGSVTDQIRLEALLTSYHIQTVYHAAAYKHVPIVEHNISEGVRNNIFGTLYAATAAINANVERFILISTDKAVRPTNIMGATKRAAEIILQNLNDQPSETLFSMVRFGNVLGSSGSVVPLFTQQIKSGGPVTVTHKDINRYFMTIREAASLVIQAGSMAKGGEVFVLDMGDVVKISDLAHKMITLMGRSVKDEENPDGEIEIAFTGLRPGEKLYEELLIGENVSGTKHPKILKANEDYVDYENLMHTLKAMESAIADSNSDLTKQCIRQLVSEYSSTDLNVDWLAKP